MMVPLTQGKYAAIDEDDAPKIAGYRWNANRNRGDLWYARTEIREPGKKPKYIGMHRIIIGAKPNQLVDHIDGDGLNNRRANLRIVTNAENQRNRKVFSNCTGYKGVHPADSISTPWRATITHAGVTRSAGYYAEAWRAALAYDIAAIETHGEHAAPNFPAELVRDVVQLRALAACVPLWKKAVMVLKRCEMSSALQEEADDLLAKLAALDEKGSD